MKTLKKLRFKVVGLLAAMIAAVQADVRIPVADGFDYPVGKPDGVGYYVARGLRLRSPQHFGEDWNGNKGGDTDYGDPVYASADGIVTFAADVKQGWGNVVLTRHAFRDADGQLKFIDTLNGHLSAVHVKVGQLIKRGQLIGAIGSNNGMYPAHLHFEMRSDLKIGMHRRCCDPTLEHWIDPTTFIKAHRKLKGDIFAVSCPTGTYQEYCGYKGL